MAVILSHIKGATLGSLVLLLLVTPCTHAQYSGGSGEPNDPYQIATAADLIMLGETQDDYDKHFIMTADIDLDPNLPDGQVFAEAIIAPNSVRYGQGGVSLSVHAFRGIFNGNGYVIDHLMIEGKNPGTGLFGGLGSNGRISNLRLEQADVSGASYVGILVGKSYGSVSKCYSTGMVNGDQYIGGLVGCNDGGAITLSYTSCSVSGDQFIGGLVGLSVRGRITSSYSTGLVNGDDRVGGLVGNNNGPITSSYSISSVSGGNLVGGLVGCNDLGPITSSYSTSSVSGSNLVGGLVGRNIWGPITLSYSDGSVRGHDEVGGLVGFTNGSITSSYSTSTVNGDQYIGGLAGRNDNGSIISSYSTGSVNGDDHSGGLVGSNWMGTITSSYSTGAVSGEGPIGGLVGYNNDRSNGIIISCFWDIETSGLAHSSGGTGRTTTQMQDINTFLNAGWDLVEEVTNGTANYWQMQNGDYPSLAVFDGHVPIEPQGSGTQEDPYLVRDVNELGSIWYRPVAHYCLAGPIDLSDITWNNAVIPRFSGSLDGNSHAIAGLHIKGGYRLGLIGVLSSSGKVSNLGLTEIDVNGIGDHVGGLVGHNDGSISSSYSTGMVSGGSYIGGLVGYSWGPITSSYSIGAVSGIEQVGGLVGLSHGSITLSYSTGTIHGGKFVGGLVGDSYSRIDSSYSTGTVNGNRGVGGLVGKNHEGTITLSYSVGAVSGAADIGGLVGWNFKGSITSGFWDTETSGQLSSDGGIGLTTQEMMNPEILGLNGLANDPRWILDADRDYPRLAWQGTMGQTIPEPIIDWINGQGTPELPYEINTIEQLLLFSKASVFTDKCLILTRHLDLSDLTLHQAMIPYFDGQFDGNCNSIHHLTILGNHHAGFFGMLSKRAHVRNLGLETMNIKGDDYVGGLVGHNRGSITSSYSSGSVNGHFYIGGLVGYNNGSITSGYSTVSVWGRGLVGGLAGINWGSITLSYSGGSVRGHEQVGGLVGDNNGSITSSYSAGSIHGNSWIGGLVGLSGFYGQITSSYSTGMVKGDDLVGGLVGLTHGTITSSFWDTETSGMSESDGGTGLSTAEMQAASTFLETGWDFIDETENGTEDIWWIDEGQDYPRLWWEQIVAE